jgi:hypothetical protein
MDQIIARNIAFTVYRQMNASTRLDTSKGHKNGHGLWISAKNMKNDQGAPVVHVRVLELANAQTDKNAPLLDAKILLLDVPSVQTLMRRIQTLGTVKEASLEIQKYAKVMSRGQEEDLLNPIVTVEVLKVRGRDIDLPPVVIRSGGFEMTIAATYFTGAISYGPTSYEALTQHPDGVYRKTKQKEFDARRLYDIVIHMDASQLDAMKILSILENERIPYFRYWVDM